MKKAKAIAKAVLEDDEVNPKEFAMSTPVSYTLQRPYTRNELVKIAGKTGDVSAILEFNIWDLIGCDVGELNEVVSERITDDANALENIAFEPVAVVRGQLMIKVSGNINDWLTYGDE